MKTYRIKRSSASILVGLPGLHMTPSECWRYVNINVIDRQFNPCSLNHLPENCNSKLVHDFLRQMQSDRMTSIQIKKLRIYLQLAKNKDKNNEIKCALKKAIKQIFLGLLVILASVGGFGLMGLLIGLVPAGASLISFLIIPIVGGLAWGGLKLAIGCLKFVANIFSICFMRKNTDQLPALEKELFSYLQSTLPPCYEEVMKNELPTFEEAVRNIAALSTMEEPPPPAYSSISPLSSRAAHFTQHPHSISNHSVMNTNLLPNSQHRFR